MKFKVTAKLFFDNGTVKKVDWIEANLYKKGNVGGKDVELPLTLEEAENEVRKLFLTYTKQEGVLTIPNIQGELSVIPFKKVTYATVSVSEYNEQEDARIITAEDFDRKRKELGINNE